MGVKVKNIGRGFANYHSYSDDTETFIRINEAFKDIGGGKDLSTLIEEGRVFDMRGERIGRAGLDTKISPEIVPVDFKDACDELKTGGIIILDEAAGNRPRHVYMEKKWDNSGDIESMDMFVTDPMDKNELKNYYDTLADDALSQLEMPAKPGFLNRLWDSISRFFGGKGTPEMERYRYAEMHVKDLTEYYNLEREGYKRVEDMVKDAPDLKKGLENYSMLEKAVSDEKLGYEVGSEEWYDDSVIQRSFRDGVLEIACQDADVMKLVISMGADGSIKKLYDTYKENFYGDDRTVEQCQKEIQKMLKDTLSSRAVKKDVTENVSVKTGEDLVTDASAQLGNH